MEKTMYRIPEKGIIGGVCAGVAEHYGMKPDTIRILYLIAQFLTFPMIFTYLFQWFVTPVKK
ncbi:PspC domain-containing protein [Corynebacterium felinum]|uniref:Phage shock protein C n=1 Tax=Corynebacterium felinum TaxID=131318 RepID=A0ABU2B7J2_9CORY|nr:PspC domain-containing protein [Corynebacterium felinum]MDF5819939.1 PspC domain-containing protein [Corynebacterium felinum]MDR7354575.1 phage shock protein C [Corynebacterium felinum]WJY93942.1 Phage shock protein C [Corynebacterium felinum]